MSVYFNTRVEFMFFDEFETSDIYDEDTKFDHSLSNINKKIYQINSKLNELKEMPKEQKEDFKKDIKVQILCLYDFICKYDPYFKIYEIDDSEEIFSKYKILKKDFRERYRFLGK